MKKIVAFLLLGIILICCGCSQKNAPNGVFQQNINIAASGSEDTTVQEETQSTNTEASSSENSEDNEDEEKPMIALTFDDGPCPNTGRLLDVLEKYGVKATFFIVGERIAGREAVLKRMAEEGHDIGGHGWSHLELTKLKKSDIDTQMTKTKEKILDVTGYESKIMRPSYGSWNENVKNVAKKSGISLVNWNVDTEDWKSRDPKKIAKEIMKNADDGDIILCHDLYNATIEAMEKVIPKLQKKGYKIVTVTELLSANGGKMNPGQVYYFG